MDGFFLLAGHLVGDYVVQNDWQAANKTNPHPGPKPRYSFEYSGVLTADRTALDERNARWKAEDWDGYESRQKAWLTGHLACTVHCLLYTLAVWACSFWWMPWWGAVACFAVHWPLDRFRLAGRWMRNVSGQKAFASGPLSPWSIIVVDNTFHLLTLGVIAALAGRV